GILVASFRRGPIHGIEIRLVASKLFRDVTPYWFCAPFPLIYSARMRFSDLLPLRVQSLDVGSVLSMHCPLDAAKMAIDLPSGGIDCILEIDIVVTQNLALDDFV